MATIIAFVSQKGGVGKSTLSRALAREAAASGLKVKIADLEENLANNRRSPLATGNADRIRRYEAALVRLRST